jgi:hypothetical protein
LKWEIENVQPNGEESEDLVFVRSGVDSYVGAILKKFDGFSGELESRGELELLQLARVMLQVKSILVI